jgi:hypothetical protein
MIMCQSPHYNIRLIRNDDSLPSHPTISMRCLSFFSLQVFSMRTSAAAIERPPLVQEALKNNRPLYYFGLGSNMLRSKLENRGADGSKIEVESIEPAIIPNHRLSFNMRGFPPLEPGMGSLEPCSNSSTRPLLAYEKDECHGALVLLTAENYSKVMASEGVSPNVTNPGYEEVVVMAVPYDTSKPPVQAVALRARSHIRLAFDPSPSARYMKILREGAAELNLKPCYQEYLNNHPVQLVPFWLKKVAQYNLIFTFTFSGVTKWKGPSKLQSFLVFRVYVPSNANVIAQFVSNAAMFGILLPGSAFG